VMTRLATTRTISDPSDGPGRALITAARHIDVGGVVMDYGIDVANGPFADDPEPALGTGRMFVMCALVVDRMDGDGLPTALVSWDPFQSSTPVASVTATTPTANTLDIDRPTRMLWQRTFNLDYRSRIFVTPTTGNLYVPNDQRVAIRHGTLNKRLKVRLTDELGLYFVRAYRASAVFDLDENTPAANAWFRGSIYYRYAF